MFLEPCAIGDVEAALKRLPSLEFPGDDFHRPDVDQRIRTRLRIIQMLRELERAPSPTKRTLRVFRPDEQV